MFKNWVDIIFHQSLVSYDLKKFAFTIRLYKEMNVVETIRGNTFLSGICGGLRHQTICGYFDFSSNYKQKHILKIRGIVASVLQVKQNKDK